MSRNHLHDACESIDASVFSSDMLFDDERRAMLNEYLGRWNRAIQEHEAPEDAPEGLGVKTAAEREAAFRADLAELLKKHEAELEITDDGEPWGRHSGIAIVSMYSKHDDDGNPIADYTEFRI